MADILDLDIQQEEEATFEDANETEGIETVKGKARTRKGRGFQTDQPRERFEDYESIQVEVEVQASTDDMRAQKSVEGWILIVTGVHEEAHEDDVHGRFSDYGEIKNLHLNLDRRTGFLKGYALVEYENFKEAQSAKAGLDGSELLGNKISVDWSFVKQPVGRKRRH